MVPDHLVHFGAEWVPRWKYEAEVAGLIRQRLSIHDAFPCPALPWQIRVGEPVLRAGRMVRRRLVGETRYGAERSDARVEQETSDEGTVQSNTGETVPSLESLQASASSAALR